MSRKHHYPESFSRFAPGDGEAQTPKQSSIASPKLRPKYGGRDDGLGLQIKKQITRNQNVSKLTYSSFSSAKHSREHPNNLGCQTGWEDPLLALTPLEEEISLYRLAGADPLSSKASGFKLPVIFEMEGSRTNLSKRNLLMGKLITGSPTRSTFFPKPLTDQPLRPKKIYNERSGKSLNAMKFTRARLNALRSGVALSLNSVP